MRLVQHGAKHKCSEHVSTFCFARYRDWDLRFFARSFDACSRHTQVIGATKSKRTERSAMPML